MRLLEETAERFWVSRILLLVGYDMLMFSFLIDTLCVANRDVPIIFFLNDIFVKHIQFEYIFRLGDLECICQLCEVHIRFLYFSSCNNCGKELNLGSS